MAAKKKPTTKSGKKSTGAKKSKRQVEVKPTHEQIAGRAYEIWLRKGRPSDQDKENWVEAESELRQAGDG